MVGAGLYLMERGRKMQEQTYESACIEAPNYPAEYRDGEPRINIYQVTPHGKWHGFLEIFKVNPHHEGGGFWLPERDLPMYTCANMPSNWAPTELDNKDKDKLIADLQSAADLVWEDILNEKHQEETTEKIYMQLPPSGTQKKII